MTDRSEPGRVTSTDQLEAEQRGQPIPFDRAEPGVTPLDPYTNLAEHGRQSSNGTHAFDPGCNFCLRLYWEDQQDAATPRPGLVEALTEAVAAAWELNLTEPDRGDGDPLSDLDDALGALADRLGITQAHSVDDFRAALASGTGEPGLNELRKELRDAVTRLPEPTLGLKGGVNRGAVIDVIDDVFSRHREQH